MKKALLSSAGALALIAFGAGGALAGNDADQGLAGDDQLVVQDSLNENGQINLGSRNKDSLNDNSVEIDASREQEAEAGGQLANNGGSNVKVENEYRREDDHSFEQEAEDGGMAANNGGRNLKVEKEFELDQEAESGGQLANNGGRNVRTETEDSFNDRSTSLEIGDVAVLVSQQTLTGSAAFIGVRAHRGDITTGSITYGDSSNHMAAGNLTSSNNTGIGSNALAASSIQANGAISIGD